MNYTVTAVLLTALAVIAGALGGSVWFMSWPGITLGNEAFNLHFAVLFGGLAGPLLLALVAGVSLLWRSPKLGKVLAVSIAALVVLLCGGLENARRHAWAMEGIHMQAAQLEADKRSARAVAQYFLINWDLLVSATKDGQKLLSMASLQSEGLISPAENGDSFRLVRVSKVDDDLEGALERSDGEVFAEVRCPELARRNSSEADLVGPNGCAVTLAVPANRKV